MSDSKIHRIPLVSLDDPRYSHLARRVTFPPSERGVRGKFYPALAGFSVGDSAEVDVSYYYSFNREPLGGFDRHLRTEELFVVLEGDFCIPLAACKEPDNPDEQPTPGDFVGVIVREGEGLILRPNVWHNGGWPLDPEKGVRFLMVLSGHRPGASHQGRVDHIVQKFPNEETIYPDWKQVR